MSATFTVRMPDVSESIFQESASHRIKIPAKPLKNALHDDDAGIIIRITKDMIAMLHQGKNFSAIRAKTAILKILRIVFITICFQNVD